MWKRPLRAEFWFSLTGLGPLPASGARKAALLLPLLLHHAAGREDRLRFGGLEIGQERARRGGAGRRRDQGRGVHGVVLQLLGDRPDQLHPAHLLIVQDIGVAAETELLAVTLLDAG